MKVLQNIERSNYPNKNLLRCVVTELIPLRGDEYKTEDYYNEYLTTDLKYERWKADRYPKVFSAPEGAISKNEAYGFRMVLLDVIMHDKYSFGYLYWLLGSEKNRRLGDEVHNCMMPSRVVEYAIQFDWDDVEAEIVGIMDLQKKKELLISKRGKSRKCTDITGEPRTSFEEKCTLEIEDISEIISSRNKPSLESTKQNKDVEQDFYNKVSVMKLRNCNLVMIESDIKQAEAEIKQEPISTQKGRQSERSIDASQHQYKFDLTKDIENKVLKVYKFWNNPNDSTKIQVNIFKETTQTIFLDMVRTADFTTLYNTPKIKQRVGIAVTVLSRILGENWEKEAARKLNKTIRDLQKNTQFAEFDALKKEFLR